MRLPGLVCQMENGMFSKQKIWLWSRRGFCGPGRSAIASRKASQTEAHDAWAGEAAVSCT